MKVLIFLFIPLYLLVIITNVYSSEVKQGDKVTIVVPGTVARLCPHPNCGSNQHFTRIPKDTVLKIEGIIDVKSGMLKVKWFQVTYKGKRGWISIFDTNKAQ